MGKKYFFILFLLLLFVSCSQFFTSKEINIKYREKNFVEILRVDSFNGNVDIIGWPKDFIEINTKKRIYSGFVSDINIMETLFYFNPTNKELLIKTKIPARIDGSIDLKIYIPFTLLKVFIDSQKGDIFINDYLGDVELTNSNGNINMIFQGNILRINSINSKLNLVVKSYTSTDIIINSENCENRLFIESVGKNSYLDLICLNTFTSIHLSYEIEHKILIKAMDENDIVVKYQLDNKKLIKAGYVSFFGTFGQNPELFNIDIWSEKGKVNVIQLTKYKK